MPCSLLRKPRRSATLDAFDTQRTQSMLRIEELDSGDLVTFVLSGRIQKENLKELKSLLEKHHKSVVLDLQGVKLVDRDTVGFLASFETDQAKITNCPRYIREWILRERAQP
jgi:ABC-type transporter Mla MlaB component